MLKLYDIFLRKFLLLFTSIFLFMAMISYFWIKEISIEQTKTDLLHNIDIFALHLENFTNIDAKVDAIRASIGVRVTIINKDGLVIAESHKDKTLLDNHLQRTEVLESKYNGYGSVIRYSDTVKKDFLYVSKKKFLKIEGIPQEYYIRMARDLAKIDEDYFILTFKVAILFFFFIGGFFLIALRMSKQVEFETNAILQFLEALIKQKKSLKIESNYSYELKNITQLLTKVSASLSKKDKQKSKYTAKLKASNRQKDDIIAAISHEFKNPIAVISGYSQTLRDDTELNENIRHKFLEKIYNNSQKLTSMIDRLRLSIKLEEGKQPYSFTKVNIFTLITSIVEDIKESYPSRDIVIEVEDKTLVQDMDETMMNICIVNLIENGLKYSQDGVTIRITDKKIAISDFGIGVKAEDIPKLTEKFYRVSSNGWNNSMGVGLSLVANILTLHTFTLEIQSVENEGSTFSIVF